MHPALLDRLEIINLPGYTHQEKAIIAKNFLIPKQMEENGLEKTQIIIPKESIDYVTKYYTREAGVRSLERLIGSLCRKVAFDYLKSRKKDEKTEDQVIESVIINQDLIHSTLGHKFFDDDVLDRIDQSGIAIGMAWTEVGGKILLVEASKSLGKGKIEVTGKLGDVMKESVKTALGWIKANIDFLSSSLGNIEIIKKKSKFIEVEDREEHILDTVDIHIHFPAAAIPKDGPSAGITIAIALVKTHFLLVIYANINIDFVAEWKKSKS